MKLGEHILLDFSCSNIKNILNNLDEIEIISLKLINILNLKKLNCIKHKFKPYGLSLVLLLEESHLSIHTWPEFNSACIDIFSCNKKGINRQLVEEYLNSKFEIKNIFIKLINREVN